MLNTPKQPSVCKFTFIMTSFCSLILLSACGGSPDNNDSSINWEMGVFPQASSLKNFCQTPRSGNYPDQQGSAFHEKMWLRSWSNDFYLWYDEIPDRNPEGYTVAEYFDLLVTDELVITENSVALKDKYHYTVETSVFEARFESGESFGYGARFAIDNFSDPRTVTVMYSEPNTPATASSVNLQRGTRILSIDGVDINSDNSNDLVILNNGLYPSSLNESHQMTVQSLDDDSPRQITITSATITSSPVQQVTTIDTETGKVGYMLFNSHIEPAESALVSAINTLADESITDLILDLRYNGGGLSAIGSQLAYMIAGPANTTNKIYSRQTFNDKYPATNPITGNPLTPTPFIDETVGFSLQPGASLPSLELSRVFVLTTDDTCSASEGIMNGLRGIGVEVIQIGDTTCGKPYGFYPQDNCGTTYFTVQFKSENQLGFGDYANGFTPENSSDASFATSIPGCYVEDDLNHGFGDVNEALISAALFYRNNGSCPSTNLAVSSQKSSLQKKRPDGRVDLIAKEPPPWTQLQFER